MNEMGLSQADARRLNVSRVCCSATLGSIPIRRFCVRRPVPGRPRATTIPAEDRFFLLFRLKGRNTTVPQLVADHFQASGKKNLRYYGAKSSSQCRVCMQEKTSCVRSLNGRQRRNRLCWAREHVSWTQQQWASVLFTNESRFTMESDSGRLLIWRNSALDTINPTLLKDTVIGRWWNPGLGRDLARWPH
ncbi:paired domain-containing protein [Trichonephila clavipes]|nr:paired domain-containing protein [Trichonephila clavipes]